jgi:NADPH:quinone reductase-like Zn-dependent oxidoreductase
MRSSKPSNKSWIFLRELMEDNNIVPAIDRTYPLNGTAEAMRYFEDEHAKAKVVITIDHEE